MGIAIPLLDNDGHAVTLVRPWGPNYVVALDAMPILAEMVGSQYARVVLTDHMARIVPEPTDQVTITVRITITHGNVTLHWEAAFGNTIYASRQYRPAVLAEIAD